MKNRLSKFSNSALLVAGLLTTCGLTCSCSDDYDLDDKEPSWLGASIYHYLENGSKDGNTYQNYVKLIDDLDYASVLGKTGSKTLFAADDEAFDRFFAEGGENGDKLVNPWGVTAYDQLSEAQKKILLRSVMLDNASLINMLSNKPGPVKGQAMRTANSTTVYDTVQVFRSGLDLYEHFLPENNNYWDYYRQKEQFALVSDGTTAPLVHFLQEQLDMNKISYEDLAFIFNRDVANGEAYLFNHKITEPDITCKNGYIHKMEGVLVPPSNMASVIATNGKTNLYSRMLDRFSAPYYNANITAQYRSENPGTPIDSIFEKRYFSDRSKGNAALSQDPNGNTVPAQLSYDPGWNMYIAGESGTTNNYQNDFGVMFVPTDEALSSYFETGAGKALYERYDGELDSIPLETLSKLLNNQMKLSFISSSPSKFNEIMNDAQDPMGVRKEDVEKTLVAGNGIIYITNKVYSPIAYEAVSAPVTIGDKMNVFKYAIKRLQYDAYLLSTGSKYSFIVPSDEALKCYVDPVSLELKGSGINVPRAFKFNWDSKTQKVNATVFAYDKNTATVGDSIGYIEGGKSFNDPIKPGEYDLIENRLLDMLEYHVVVHDEGGDYLQPGRYYKTKGGGSIYISGLNDSRDNLKLQGGYQIQLQESGLNGGIPVIANIYYNEEEFVEGIYSMTNGKTYVVDNPLMAPSRTVFQRMQELTECSKFLDLLSNADMDEILGTIIDPTTGLPLTSKTQEKYEIFVKDKYNSYTDLVRFFSTYNYTIYVPDNKAVEQAIAENVIPTWEKIKAEPDDSVRGVMVHELNRFLRYHFQDNSIFVDKLSVSGEYETAALSDDNRFYRLNVNSDGSGNMTVKDNSKQIAKVLKSNIMARELKFGGTDIAAGNIETSAFVVMHVIDKVLDFNEK